MIDDAFRFVGQPAQFGRDQGNDQVEPALGVDVRQLGQIHILGGLVAQCELFDSKCQIRGFIQIDLRA